MKKTALVLLICTLLAIMGSCGPRGIYNTLWELALHSDTIAMATVESFERMDYRSGFYHMEDITVLGGQDMDSVSVYAGDEVLEEGKKYCLFLRNEDSVFWPMPLTLMDEISVFEIDGDKIIAPERYRLDDMSVDEFTEKVSKLITRKKSVPVVIDELPYDELIEASDVIFTAKFIDPYYSDSYMGNMPSLEPLETFKGKVANGYINIKMPKGLRSGQTYLIFRTDGIQSMPTRNNSVINVKSDEYAEIMKLLEK